MAFFGGFPYFSPPFRVTTQRFVHPTGCAARVLEQKMATQPAGHPFLGGCPGFLIEIQEKCHIKIVNLIIIGQVLIPLSKKAHVHSFYTSKWWFLFWDFLQHRQYHDSIMALPFLRFKVKHK